jgi:hypothetical protein
MEKQLADKLSQIAIEQLKVSVKFKQPRLEEIKKSEDLYLNKTKKPLKGRFNIPIPVMGGFVDELMSKIDDPPNLTFTHRTEADYMKAKKVTAAWQQDSTKEESEWDISDLDCKKLACFSGVGISKIYAESDPKYRSVLDIVDINDFNFEPMGGAILERHLFCGEENIFKTKFQLEEGIGNIYDAEQVGILIANISSGEQKKNQDLYENKTNRFAGLGLDPKTNNYVGVDLYNLTEWYMQHNGKRYYLLFDYPTGIWVRCEELKNVFESELWPYTPWHTHRDRFNFLSKAPCDDMRPIAEGIQILVNQAFENRQKRNWGQRAYDDDIFPDPAQLEFRPAGLVKAKPGPNRRISDGIYVFETPEVSGTIDLIAFMDNFAGKKTGVATGEDQDKKVGIYYGDLKKVADRMNLYNKYYKNAQRAMGRRYVWGLKEHMPEKLAVKVIGDKGIDWQDLIREDLDVELDIAISGSNSQAEADAIKAKQKNDSLIYVTGHPLLQKEVNPRWATENLLANGGWDDEQIRVGMDTKNDGNQEISAEAADENQKIVEGEEVKPNRKATTAHIQKHIDFSYSLENDIAKSKGKEKESELEAQMKLMAHIEAEMPIAQENMTRAAVLANPLPLQGQGGQPGQPPEQPMPLDENQQLAKAPATVAGTMQRSQQIANALTPNQ